MCWFLPRPASAVAADPQTNFVCEGDYVPISVRNPLIFALEQTA